MPVNISCIQDQPDYVFHITAYNSQVDKILDVRLTQPGNFYSLDFIFIIRNVIDYVKESPENPPQLLGISIEYRWTMVL